MSYLLKNMILVIVDPLLSSILLHFYFHCHVTSYLNAYLSTFFDMKFESRDSDHTVVSGALNNPVRDTLNVSKAFRAALEESFV